MEDAKRERLYELIKTELCRAHWRRDARVDLQSLADVHQISVTPVREIMFRLVGERLVTLAPYGGFAPSTLDPTDLAGLYAWNAHHLLAAVHLLTEAVLAQSLAPTVRMLDNPGQPDPVGIVEQLFRALGQATGLPEFVVQIDSANDRLRRARMAELRIVHQPLRELRTIVSGAGLDVKKNVRRRLIAYHRRRVEQAPQISQLL